MGCQEQTPGSQVGVDAIAWSPDCRDGEQKSRMKSQQVERKSSDEEDNGSGTGVRAPPPQLTAMVAYFGHHLDW